MTLIPNFDGPTVTVGEAAERLGMSIGDVLDLVYEGKLPATVQKQWSGLLIPEDALGTIATRAR